MPPLSAVEVLTRKPNPAITIPNSELSWFSFWSHSQNDNAASDLGRDYSPEEKEAEAVAIGYKIGSHQFKVSNGDSIFTERLKFCEVNDKLILNKVLLLGSPTQTIIGRPILPDAAVHAVVEEHALDAKVIIFKKKRRKNYRRTKGHRQELTKLRITDIQGIEKQEIKTDGKPLKAAVKNPEKIAAADYTIFVPVEIANAHVPAKQKIYHPPWWH
ncbi:hypothetical protein GOBAR_DD27307 [Gossypium barbadense]|nr:hypothetical protein GOBAR_DD27307 [Gossypium barbadense]